MPYAIVEYFCNHHGILERARIPILRNRKVKKDSLDPIVVKKPKGVFLKAVKVGSLRTKHEIERFLKSYFESLGASTIKIDFEGW